MLQSIRFDIALHNDTKEHTIHMSVLDEHPGQPFVVQDIRLVGKFDPEVLLKRLQTLLQIMGSEAQAKQASKQASDAMKVSMTQAINDILGAVTKKAPPTDQCGGQCDCRG